MSDVADTATVALMSSRWFSTILVAATLAGCASAPPIDPNVERIAFEPEAVPFCGRCETVKFVASADGVLTVETGYWAGDYRDWRKHRSVTRITPEQFADFSARLAAYRPPLGVVRWDETCRDPTPDMGGLRVTWARGRDTSVRVFDYGCPNDGAMSEAARLAPAVLGVKARY